MVEEAQLAEEARLAEEVRLAEVKRLAKEARLAEVARLAEEAQLHGKETFLCHTCTGQDCFLQHVRLKHQGSNTTI